MTRPLRALRLRRLTASFGLALPAVIAAAGILAVASIPTAALAHSRHHRDSGASDSSSHRSHETVRVRVLTARLRSGPSEERHSSALLDEGQTARVVGHRGDWTELRTASGDRGWVRSDLLRVAKQTKSDDGQGDATPRRPRHHHESEESPARVAKAAAPRSSRHHHTAQVAHAAMHASAKPKPTAVATAKPHPHRAAAVAAAAPARPLVRSAAVASAPAPSSHEAERTAEGRSLTVDSPTATMTISDAHITLATMTEKTAEKTAEAPVATAAPAPKAQTASAITAVTTAAPVMVAQATATVKHAELDRSLSRGERLVRSALAYRGTPYRMGATGRGAFDCSGFTMYLFDKEGTQLPRTAEEQYAKGQPIAKSDLMPGDLVFFRNTYKHGISHVGIYIGNGQFCHAAGRGKGVRVDNLDKTFYVNHWAGARRPR